MVLDVRHQFFGSGNMNFCRPHPTPATPHPGAAWRFCIASHPLCGFCHPSLPPGICRHVRHGATSMVQRDGNVAALRQLRHFWGWLRELQSLDTTFAAFIRPTLRNVCERNLAVVTPARRPASPRFTSKSAMSSGITKILFWHLQGVAVGMPGKLSHT